MKILVLLCLVAACGEKRERSEGPPSDPEPGSDFIVQRDVKLAPMRTAWMLSTDAVDIQSDGPVKFERVKIVPIAEGTTDGIKPVPGVFSVQFTPRVVDSKAMERIQTRALCRIGTYTHAIVDFRGPYKPEGKEIGATINIQPYTDAPTLCQLDWFGAGPGAPYPIIRLATACYRSATRDVVTGGCPTEDLPPNLLPSGARAAFDVIPTTTTLDEGAFAFNAVVTSGTDVSNHQRWRIRMRCDDGKSLRVTKSGSEALPADTLLLPPGGSMFVVGSVFFDKTGDRDARCELQLGTDPSKDFVARATYCVDKGVFALGACKPALRTR